MNLSVAIIPMSHHFGWNSSVAGLVQSSFFWGYALSQLPGGWLAKIFGGRFVFKTLIMFHYLHWEKEEIFVSFQCISLFEKENKYTVILPVLRFYIEYVGSVLLTA